MKTITIKVPVEMAGQIEQLLGEYYANLQEQMQSVVAARARIKKSDAPARAPAVLKPETASSDLAPGSYLHSLQIAVANPRTRLGYGKARNAVVEFLKSRNGAGVTVKEIQSEAGVSYGSAYRYLQSLKEEKQVKQGDNGVWIWVG